ncbi:GNAT family N-acetyltransferase [Streptomyces sp. NPDC001816]|uniref:GNAT family N-acetyltransferase n=1 Tax=Streptomyces sp. NPDC001816 TaxID=3364612 RepID=UPI0036AFC55C
MKALPRAATAVRFRWNAGTGPWAAARGCWASALGRRFPHTVTRSAGDRLTLAYQGFPEGLTYVLPYLRAQLPVPSDERASGPLRPESADVSPLTWREIRRGAGAADADLLVVGCSSRRARMLPRDRSLILPFRVHALIDVVGDPATMLSSVSPNERRQFAQLRRRHEWTYETTDGVDDLRFFYERMHLPTMEIRHGEETRSADWATTRDALFRHGMLLFVNEGGKRVAGVVCRFEERGRALRMRLFGVLDGDETHYRSGAAKAVYYLTVEWAARHGVRCVDLAGGDPFPGKGVFQFKRRLHPTIIHPQDHYRDRRVYVRAVRDTPAVRDFLVATPMLSVDQAGRIVAVYFHDSTRPARFGIRAATSGVHGSRTVDLDEFLATARSTG